VRWLAALVLIAAACGGPDDEEEPRCEGCPPSTLIWSGIADSEAGARVTAIAPSPGEPPWFAGSYDQILHIDGSSTGADESAGDVFAARIGARDLALPYVGVALGPDALTVVGIAPDGEDGVIAIARGALPGGAPYVEGIWLDRTAAVVRRATLATMAMGQPAGVAAVMARDAHGWPLVAVVGVDIDAGELSQVTGTRTAVIRVGQALRVERVFSLADVEVLAIAAAPDDTIVIGGRYTTPPPDWPNCPEVRCGFIALIDAGTADGEPLRWRRILRAVGGAQVTAVAAAPDGDVAALVETDGELIEPPPGQGPGAGVIEAPVFLAYAAADGSSPFYQLVAPAAVNLAGRALAHAEDRSWVLALAVNGTLAPTLDDFASDPSGDHDAVIAEVDSASGAIWSLPLRTGFDLSIEALTVNGDEVLVGGTFIRDLAIPAQSIFQTDSTSMVDRGFALEIAR
jgi:hypothetical protein